MITSLHSVTAVLVQGTLGNDGPEQAAERVQDVENFNLNALAVLLFLAQPKLTSASEQTPRPARLLQGLQGQGVERGDHTNTTDM